MGITVAKTSVLVLALCKLHNFCIDEKDERISKLTPGDSIDITMQGGIDLESPSQDGNGNENVEVVENVEDDGDDGTYRTMRRVDDLLDGGQHRDDHSPNWARLPNQTSLPFWSMLTYIEQQGFQRPSIR